MSRPRKDLDELRELIDGIEVAMLTTAGPEGLFSSRPLRTQQVDEDGLLWFITRRDTRAVEEFIACPDVCLTYASPERNQYVAVYGSAGTVVDPAKLDALWSPINAVLFPEGRTDPGLVLLRIEPQRAECWVGPSSTVGKVLAFAGAALSGDPRGLGARHDLRV